MVACMERVECYRAVCQCVLVWWGTCGWSDFRAAGGRMKGRKVPAGEMCHSDKMAEGIGSCATAPGGAVWDSTCEGRQKRTSH